jgi:hypothetical protein
MPFSRSVRLQADVCRPAKAGYGDQFLVISSWRFSTTLVTVVIAASETGLMFAGTGYSPVRMSLRASPGLF